MSEDRRLVCRVSYELDGEERILLVGDEPALIGRAPDCDLVLAHESVSRNHARISHDKGAWTVSDLGSKNGIKVNTHATSEQVLAVHEALDLLAAEDPKCADLVKLRYFAGMTMEEAASVLELSQRSTERLWTYSRAWLRRQISEQ